MKIGGKEISGPTEQVLVIPRVNGDVVFKARAVLNMSEFDDQVPVPKAPAKMMAGGKWEANTDSEGYKKALEQWGEIRKGFIVTRSLIPSEIEWDTVDFDKPDTWVNWEQDLLDAKFSKTEVDLILMLCVQANSLDEATLRKAREAFLLGQEILRAKSSGLDTEQPSTPSGVPASDSE